MSFYLFYLVAFKAFLYNAPVYFLLILFLGDMTHGGNFYYYVFLFFYPVLLIFLPCFFTELFLLFAVN